MGERGTFPPLLPYEIVACMSELNIPITEDEIRKPTPATLRHIYVRLLELLTYVTKEEMEQPHFDAIHLLEYPELHEESIPELMLSRHLKEFMNTVQVPDFSMKDVYKPTPERTILCLSAVINFVKFREEKLLQYSQCAAESEALRENKLQAEEENRMLQEALANLKRQIAEEEPAILLLQQETNALEAGLCKLSKEQQTLTTETHNMRQTVKELNSTLSDAKGATTQARQEGQRLRSQIVTSPEKLKKSIADLEQSVEEEKKQLQAADVRARELQARMDCLANIENNVSVYVNIMQECLGQQEKIKKQRAELMETRACIAEHESELHDSENQQVQLKRQIQVTNEKMQKLQQRHNERQETSQKTLDEVLSDHQNALSQYQQNQGVIAQNEQIVKRLNAKMQEMRKQHQEEMQKLRELYQELEAQVHAYHHSLTKAMRATGPYSV